MSLLNKKKYEDEIECLKAKNKELCCRLNNQTPDYQSLQTMSVLPVGLDFADSEGFTDSDGTALFVECNEFASTHGSVYGRLYLEPGADLSLPRTISAAGGGSITMVLEYDSLLLPQEIVVGLPVLDTQFTNPGTVWPDTGSNNYEVSGLLTLPDGSDINAFTVPMAAGELTLQHGDPVAIGMTHLLAAGSPGTNQALAYARLTGIFSTNQRLPKSIVDDQYNRGGYIPACFITFDDGTRGYLYPAPTAYVYSEAFSVTGNSGCGIYFTPSRTFHATGVEIYYSNYTGHTAARVSLHTINPENGLSTGIAGTVYLKEMDATSIGYQHLFVPVNLTFTANIEAGIGLAFRNFASPASNVTIPILDFFDVSHKQFVGFPNSKFTYGYNGEGFGNSDGASPLALPAITVYGYYV